MREFKGFLTAVYAQHLFDGAHHVIEERGDLNGDAWPDGGWVGFTMDMARYAHDIRKWMKPYLKNEHLEWPGVYEYEVVCPLGAWLGRNRGTYQDDDPEFYLEWYRLTIEFFNQ